MRLHIRSEERDLLQDRCIRDGPQWDTPHVGSRMPILADALQDAGCDNEDILSHCRSEGPHVRGCWVVDLILGKS